MRMNNTEVSFITAPSHSILHKTDMTKKVISAEDEEEVLLLTCSSSDIKSLTQKLCACQQQEENKIDVKGSWGTKIEAVVRSIAHVQKMSETADVGSSEKNKVKCLVFSQWDDVLLLVSR